MLSLEENIASFSTTQHEVVAPRKCQQPWLEIILVLGVSLGQSAVYSILSFINKITRSKPLGDQVTSLNNSVTPDRWLLDLSYQIAGIIFPLVPAFIALYLLRFSHGNGGRAIGFDRSRIWRDIAHAIGIAAIVGGAGLILYIAGRMLHISTKVEAANLTQSWWAIPLYLGFAWMNGMLEEVIMIGFLFTRLREKNWSRGWIIISSALLRGLYHLYQGPTGLVGNIAMGILFGCYWLRTLRVMPLVIAHFLIDAVVYIGYPLVATWSLLQ
ncbi:MAG: CPBP family intramembrane glutamic endopeptidase [Propionibacteriaceae bacterium]